MKLLVADRLAGRKKIIGFRLTHRKGTDRIHFTGIGIRYLGNDSFSS